MGLTLPCLCLVTDRSIGEPDSLVDRIAQAVDGGVDMVQIREKDLPGGELLKLVNHIQKVLAGKAILIVNERVDVAVAAGADGVQLGEDALPIAATRKMVGPQSLIGRSVHSINGAEDAVIQGADFLLAGTMYATRSHAGVNPAGPRLIESIVRQQTRDSKLLPVIGIGGITAANLGDVIQAGASGVAVITSILASADPRVDASKLKNAMLDAWRDRLSAVTREAGGGSDRN